MGFVGIAIAAGTVFGAALRCNMRQALAAPNLRKSRRLRFNDDQKRVCGPRDLRSLRYALPQ